MRCDDRRAVARAEGKMCSACCNFTLVRNDICKNAIRAEARRGVRDKIRKSLAVKTARSPQENLPELVAT
jgi:hypothetical protein